MVMKLKSKASREPRWSRSLRLSPTGWWRGNRVPIPRANSHPTFGKRPLRMRNISDQFTAWFGVRMRRFSGRYRGGAPNLRRGSSLEALWEITLDPLLGSEPSEANRTVSPFLGCQLEQFLRGDGSSRRAEASFLEVRLLPGLRAGD